MRRTGIDLSSSRCVLADVEAPAVERRQGERRGFRVHRFVSLSNADSSHALAADLKAVRARREFPRRAWINLWDLRSSHQYLLLPSAAADELDAGARHHAASILGLNDADLTIGTLVGTTRSEPGHRPKTEVSFFAAASNDIRQRLQPFVDAGFTIEGVTTPCGALWSQARLRKGALPDEVHAHVALAPAKSALGIFSNGALLYARDIDWGYGAFAGNDEVSPKKLELAHVLSTELRHSFLYVKQYWEDDVSQVLLSGDMPDIRSLTAPLIELLNIEVETLDTLAGIDASSLPDGFADQAATFRLATSIAAEPPPINLLPAEEAVAGSSHMAWGIVAGAAAAAVVMAAMIYERTVAGPAASAPVPEQSPQGAVRGSPQADAQPPATVSDFPSATGRTPVRPEMRPRSLKPSEAATAPGAASTSQDPVVSGILVSGDRRVALIAGRVVSPGDLIGTSVVRSIEPDGIIIVTADGQTRHIGLGRPANRVTR
jgi:hypothetical protein